MIQMTEGDVVHTNSVRECKDAPERQLVLSGGVVSDAGDRPNWHTYIRPKMCPLPIIRMGRECQNPELPNFVYEHAAKLKYIRW